MQILLGEEELRKEEAEQKSTKDSASQKSKDYNLNLAEAVRVSTSIKHVCWRKLSYLSDFPCTLDETFANVFMCHVTMLMVITQHQKMVWFDTEEVSRKLCQAYIKKCQAYIKKCQAYIKNQKSKLAFFNTNDTGS